MPPNSHRSPCRSVQPIAAWRIPINPFEASEGVCPAVTFIRPVGACAAAGSKGTLETPVGPLEPRLAAKYVPSLQVQEEETVVLLIMGLLPLPPPHAVRAARRVKKAIATGGWDNRRFIVFFLHQYRGSGVRDDYGCLDAKPATTDVVFQLMGLLSLSVSPG